MKKIKERYKKDKDDFLSLRESEFQEFKDYFANSFEETDLSYHEDSVRRDWIYLYQDKIAFKTLEEISQTIPAREAAHARLLDVGSTLKSVLFFANIFRTDYMEPRLLDQEGYFFFPTLNMGFTRGEGQKIESKDNSYDIITSLHAIEHFGLGRFGDTIDYYGDQKALREFARVLKPGGYLITSVPTATKDKIQFNNQRCYSPETFCDMLSLAGFEVDQELFIFSLGTCRSAGGDIQEPITRNREVLKAQADDHQSVYFTVSVLKE
jgi:SAM-dependent methyltransferase